MSLFGNTQTDNPSSPMANQTNKVQAQVTLVGEGTVFEGTLQVEDDVRAHGRIVGTLEVEGKAMIAELGAVDGDIIATDAEIAGQVEGEIRVEECLVLKSTARVDGKIETERLVVEEGARFRGDCKMGTPVSESESATREVGHHNGEVPQDESDAPNVDLNDEDMPDAAIAS